MQYVAETNHVPLRNSCVDPKDQHQGHAMELERQLKECEERTSTAAP